MSSYKNTLQYLYELERFGIRMGLECIDVILKSLGNPHLKYPVIHIGGTNGKGSTSVMLASVLQEAGCKVGLYTSPHLLKFNERIRVNGEEITDRKIVEMTERIRNRSQESEVRSQKNSKLKTQNSKLASTTFFEFTTAMAFLHFAEEHVDIAVIEVGLGGRLDATNVCKPLVSVITNVSKEHEEILGKGIRNIALEQTGIIKENGILLTGASQPSVLKVFNETCRGRNAKIYRFKILRPATRDPRLFGFHGKKWRLDKLKTNLLRRHQYKNAGLALFALEMIGKKGFKITEDAVRTGLENVRLQGRLQIVSIEPTIVLDSAHNPAGAKVLRDSLLKEFCYKKLILVVGIMADKDIKGFLSNIAPIVDLVILTKPNTPRAAKEDVLTSAAKPFAKRIKLIKNVKNAYRFAKSIAKKQDLICVTGSFYTVGEVLSNLKV
ncbi:MAG: bifunctional folylpolyglutamate synthase/dihydrofolate synthase [Deltaproteobacteria bacterium]|nr:bifunctional folylpolyglutamate synthase/dihydrofolate synthase [Deltaproteobacteria bacterium]